MTLFGTLLGAQPQMPEALAYEDYCLAMKEEKAM